VSLFESFSIEAVLSGPMTVSAMSMMAGAIALNNSLYAEGNLPTHINTVSCRGAETLLLDCPFNNVAVGSCGRFEDAGIICQGINSNMNCSINMISCMYYIII